MVELDQVGYRIGQKWILREINLKIETCQFWMIVGPNGAGKSTLLRLISGELSPHQGQIRLFGHDINAYSPQELARSFVPTFNRNAMSISLSVPRKLCCLDAIHT